MNKSCILIFFSLALHYAAPASEYERAVKAAGEHAPVWRSFSLSEVRLTDSYFKQAMDLDKQYILSLETDRLIPHVRQNQRRAVQAVLLQLELFLQPASRPDASCRQLDELPGLQGLLVTCVIRIGCSRESRSTTSTFVS